MKAIRSILLLVCIICIASQAQAGNVTKPYTFTSGTPASASQVNANFDALFNAINQGNGALPAGAIIMWSGRGAFPKSRNVFFLAVALFLQDIRINLWN